MSFYFLNLDKMCIVNQVGPDLKEFVMIERGSKVYVNIHYPVYEDFETKAVNEKNLVRLDVVHSALLMVASEYGKLKKETLEQIRDKIINNNFSFDFLCKAYEYKGREKLIAKIIVHPEIDKFDYYCIIEGNGNLKCRVKIYCGLTDIYYYRDLFSDVKWKKSGDQVVITGKAKQAEIIILIDECRVVYRNLTRYETAPYFEMMRGDVTEDQREKAHMNWLHSLNPAHVALITRSQN
jgi:hypothetical protein